MSYSKLDFYIPKSKWELLEKLREMYPTDKSFAGKSKDELKAIYINSRVRGVLVK